MDLDDDGAPITYPRDGTVFPVRAENQAPLAGVPMRAINVCELELALQLHGRAAVTAHWIVPEDRLPPET